MFKMLRALCTPQVATITECALKKTLSVSAVTAKRFVINSHFEFDQKVCIKF